MFQKCRITHLPLKEWRVTKVVVQFKLSIEMYDPCSISSKAFFQFRENIFLWNFFVAFFAIVLFFHSTRQFLLRLYASEKKTLQCNWKGGDLKCCQFKLPKRDEAKPFLARKRLPLASKKTVTMKRCRHLDLVVSNNRLPFDTEL